ncbi:MAG: glycosyltransferase [Phycisphaerales bacterium]|nr:glycosyltransferase [Phycisphaerales bacterium]MCB9856368.1 glycosyltransferase [Phycisphaerales bacterium]MCB9864040.1 glycosyltransferase [Phycisphaerales bacterium]
MPSESTLRILLRGSPRWVRMLEGQLPEVGISTMQATRDMMMPHPFVLGARWRWHRTSVLHQVMPDVRSTNTGKVFRQARKRNIPVIAHWIGSDVVRLRDHIAKHGHPPAHLFDHVTMHLADSPALAAELEELGVSGDVVRLLPKSTSSDVCDLPQVPAVVTYLPDSAQDFYRIDIIRTLARTFPKVPFYIAANDGRSAVDCPANMRFLGEVEDMDAVYRKVSVLVRICEHDSLSAMVLEALARGRYVVYSETFPHTSHACDAQTAAACLADILRASSPNLDGARYVAREFSWRHELQRLKECYEQAIERVHKK